MNTATCRRSFILAMIARWTADPRHYQITVLSGLLAWGITALGFPVTVLQVVATLSAAVVTEAFGRWLLARNGEADPTVRRPLDFDPRSPLITGLSLCLLLRVADPLLSVCAAALAVASKFAFRTNGRHVFNPANFGIVDSLILLDGAWASSGQWGSAPLAAFALACLGTVVVTRATRADVTFAFLGSYAAILVGRALWLGDPLAIPLHRLQSGALLLFAFFMISDPRTTPVARTGRVLFAVLVAVLAVVIDYALYWNNGILWALAISAPLVPAIDRWLPGREYRWSVAAGSVVARQGARSMARAARGPSLGLGTTPSARAGARSGEQRGVVQRAAVGAESAAKDSTRSDSA
jgi:Na+-translocating ferredoxin:NAD+ oxidoreductase RnfD subunit